MWDILVSGALWANTQYAIRNTEYANTRYIVLAETMTKENRMFLTGTLIVAGTLFVGGKIVHKRREKRLVDRLLPLKMQSPSGKKIISRSSSSFSKIQADIQRLTGDRLGGVGPKRQQLDSLSALAEVETSNDERVLNRDIMLSGGLMGLTAIGSLGYPLFTLISVPGLIYLTISDIQSTYQAFLERKNRATALVESILAIGIVPKYSDK